MVASNAPFPARWPSGTRSFVSAIGATVGLIVATVMLAVATLVRIDVGNIAPVDAFAVATLLTGPIAGAVMAGAAWRARTLRSWLWVVLGMTVLAVIVGAFNVSAIALVISMGNSSQSVLMAIPAFFVAGLPIGILGIILVGPFALPFTLVAAVAWAWGVRRARRRGALG
jgi:hypothetical protein